MKPLNIKFEYLHRDEGNYKTFGEIVVSNPDNISLVKARNLLEERLVDRQYFYPGKANIPLFPEHSGVWVFFSDWYEFSRFSVTEEKPTADHSIEKFIRGFKKQQSL